jgi:cytochrome b6-f complex iron-sulfur subunit
MGRIKSTEVMMATRREFCVHACQTISLASIAGALHGCGGSPTAPSAGAPLQTVSGAAGNGAVVLTIDAASPLAAVGSAALVQSTAGNFLVTRTAQDSFSAVTAICTHEQCTVTGFENQTFVCPCHGSRYTTSGTVVNGPATQPLRQFPTAFANSVLTITL